MMRKSKPSGHGHYKLERVLVIHDTQLLGRAFVKYFSEMGIYVAMTPSSREALEVIAADEFDAVILELSRSRDLALLRELVVPTVVVSSRKDEGECVAALELGADDYVAMPVGLREVVARIRAILRRRPGGGFSPHSLDRLAGLNSPERRRGVVHFGPWRLDRRRRELVGPEGQLVTLTRGDYALLDIFIDAPQRSLTRVYLLRALALENIASFRSVDVRVNRLRKKLQTAGLPAVILTERNIGYVFALPVVASDVKAMASLRTSALVTSRGR
jgi:DNA-binding response OmpR family regulator